MSNAETWENAFSGILFLQRSLFDSFDIIKFSSFERKLSLRNKKKVKSVQNKKTRWLMKSIGRMSFHFFHRVKTIRAKWASALSRCNTCTDFQIAHTIVLKLNDSKKRMVRYGINWYSINIIRQITNRIFFSSNQTKHRSNHTAPW